MIAQEVNLEPGSQPCEPAEKIRLGKGLFNGPPLHVTTLRNMMELVKLSSVPKCKAKRKEVMSAEDYIKSTALLPKCHISKIILSPHWTKDNHVTLAPAFLPHY